MKKNQILNNTIMLMIFNISKIIFPFITLPYLTRILTTETYGIVTYVKTIMSYMQIFIDFGFILSATKDIVKYKDEKHKMEQIIGDTLLARIILGIIGFFIITCFAISLPILKENILYTLLSYMAVFLSIFLMDFLFRGLEKMHVITIRFIVMKMISTILTFILIKDDVNFLLIPILEILSTTIAIILVYFEVKKLQIKICFSNLKNAIKLIKESFIYFLSNVAATSFNAFSTIVIGIYQTTTAVAYWGVCMQIVGTIQACYNPISDGIYPEMIKSKNINLVKKTIKIFTPILLVGCIIAYFLTPLGMLIIGGEEYLNAVPIFRLLIPAAFLGFFSVIFGWPTLGAIGKNKETTISTIISIAFNIVMLVLLIITDFFTLSNIAIARTITELILFLTRYYFYRKNKSLFVNG